MDKDLLVMPKLAVMLTPPSARLVSQALYLQQLGIGMTMYDVGNEGEIDDNCDAIRDVPCFSPRNPT